MNAYDKLVVGGLISAALVVLACVFLLNRGHRALLDARRDAEAAQLALKHQTVEAQESRRDLQASVADLLSKNEVLALAVESAKAAAPGAQPVSASVLQTSPEKIKTVRVAGPPATTLPGPQPCALATSDNAWFKVDLIEMQTKEQNLLITGTAELWAQGVDLADRRVLGPSRFQSGASTSAALATPAQPRWGAEAMGACAAKGCGLGGGVLFPPLAVFGLRLEARAGVLLGPDAAVLGALGLRF